MKLIADSGSTKTDWCVCQNGEIINRFQSLGMNPYFQTTDELKTELIHKVAHQVESQQIHEIFFYGAGCNAVKSPIVEDILQQVFSNAIHIEVTSDLVGAARSLCGKDKGIACILGTGSNSCLYDGKEIVANVSPLGFILGDEGSGANLGKQLVGDLLKGQLPAVLKEEFLSNFHLTTADIIEKVYKAPFPNRFLASLSPFLKDHLADKRIYDLVFHSFTSFIQRNIKQYPDYQEIPIHFIGSIAYHYQSVLQSALTVEGLHIGKIKASPMEGLLKYHH